MGPDVVYAFSFKKKTTLFVHGSLTLQHSQNRRFFFVGLFKFKFKFKIFYYLFREIYLVLSQYRQQITKQMTGVTQPQTLILALLET